MATELCMVDKQVVGMLECFLILRCSNPTGGKLLAINLLFTTEEYKIDNIANFV